MSGRGIRPTRAMSSRSMTNLQQKRALVQGKTLAQILPTTTGSSHLSRAALEWASDRRSDRSNGTDELAGTGRSVPRVELPPIKDEDTEDIHPRRASG